MIFALKTRSQFTNIEIYLNIMDNCRNSLHNNIDMIFNV